jgi:L-lactate dehydrogenase complex protein LldG
MVERASAISSTNAGTSRHDQRKHIVNDARAVVLGKIRAALNDVPNSEQVPDVVVDRSYRTVDSTSFLERIRLFVERVREYKAKVRPVRPTELMQAIAEACAARGVKRLVVPADLPDGWCPTGVTLLREPGLSNDVLEHSDGVLTAAAMGIAQTGTIVLDCGPGQGRRAITLLPDYHLCVIRDDQVVGLVPEAVASLHEAACDTARPITLISGPSATSDIELNRVEGVHGPRTLEVLLVSSLDPDEFSGPV